MAYTPFDAENGADTTLVQSKTSVFSADGQEIVEVSGTEFTSDAKMTKDGHDLVLEAPDGSTVIIEGYFLADPAPMIQSPDGSVLTPELVDSFAKAPAEFAQTGGLSDESPVGAVEETSGEAHVIRADGTIETITIGTPIYQGDIVETKGEGAVNIVFIDETSFAVSDNARLAIDEYVFDPATESGAQNFSVLRGVFVFTSGLIGRDDPDDVEIDTPVGSIGIRGTIIAGNIQPGGESEITVIEGAIVVKNGFEETTLSQQFETVKLDGFETAIESKGVMQAQDVGEMYGGVSDVAPTLFSSINDAAQENTPDAGPDIVAPAEVQPEPAVQENGQEPEAAPQAAEGENNSAPQPNGDPLNMMDPATNPMGNPMGVQEQFGDDSGNFDGENTVTPGANAADAAAPLSGPNNGADDGLANGTNNGQPDNNTGPNSPDGNLGGPDLEATPPIMNLEQLNFRLNEETKDGDVVAEFKILGNLPDVQVSFGNGVNTLASSFGAVGANFVLVQQGQFVKIIYKNPADVAGEPFNDLDGSAVNFNLTLRSPSTNLQPKTLSFSGSVADTDAAASAAPLDLNNESSPGVAIITDNGIGNQIGGSIAFGNLNGDGFDDVIFLDRIGTNGDGGQHYIVNGGSAEINGGFVGGVASVNPSSFDADFRVVTNVGDIDGDGIDDFIVADNASNSIDLFGSTSGQASVFSTLTSGADEELGISVAGLGDLNNDGYDDFAVGDHTYDDSTTDNGRIAINLTNSTNGDIFGNAPGQELGRNISSAGDFDGDGNLDIFASMTGTDQARIFLGDGTGSFPNGSGVLTLGGFDSGTGPNKELPLHNLGDINADGYTDLLVHSVGDNSAHIFLGGNSGTLGDANADQNYVNILGTGSAGDFNGDGFDDFVLITDQGGGVAGIDVMFGGNGGIGSNGVFHMVYDTGVSNLNGFKFNIAGHGDLDGDGYDDIAIGMPSVDSDGDSTIDGEVVLVYGRDTGSVAGSSIASANGEALVGGLGDNVLDDGGNNNISMNGGIANDTFLISNTNFRSLDGGQGGADKILAQGAGLDFTNVKFESISGVERIEGTVGQTITLTLDNIFNLLKSGDGGLLRLEGDATYNIDVNGNGTDDHGADTAANLFSLIPGGTSIDSANDLTGDGDADHLITIGGFDLLIDGDATLNVM